MNNPYKRNDRKFIFENVQFLNINNEIKPNKSNNIQTLNNQDSLIQPIVQKKKYQNSFTCLINTSPITPQTLNKKFVGFKPINNASIKANSNLSIKRYKPRSILSFDRLNDTGHFAPVNSSFRILNRKPSIDKYDDKKSINEEFNNPRFNQINLKSSENLSCSISKRRNNFVDFKKINNSIIFDNKEDKSLKGNSFMEINQEKKNGSDRQVSFVNCNHSIQNNNFLLGVNFQHGHEQYPKDKHEYFINNDPNFQEKNCFYEKQSNICPNLKIEHNKMINFSKFNNLKISTSLQDLEQKKIINQNINMMYCSPDLLLNPPMAYSKFQLNNKEMLNLNLLNKRSHHNLNLESLQNQISFENNQNFKIMNRQVIKSESILKQHQYNPAKIEYKMNRSLTSLEGIL
jgi:hypothetical protein